jgi:uncharacterized membrane protein
MTDAPALHLHGHGHGHGDDADVEISRRARVVVLALLAAVALASVVGLVVLWPADAEPDEGAAAQFAAPGVTFPRAEVVEVRDSCAADVFADAAATPPACAVLDVEVRSGPERGDTVQVEVIGPTAQAGLRSGDVVQLLRIPTPEGMEEQGGVAAEAQFSFFGVDRTTPLALMAGLFVLVVLVVARWRGLLALVGLVFAGWVVFRFLLPALLAGEPALWVALVAASVIMYVVLYLVHGISMRTSTALVGTIVGIGITAVLAEVAVGATRLSGVGDEGGERLSAIQTGLDFQQLLTCAVVIAGLGVLNDVTITQASAVWELRAAGPELSRRRLFTSGMRIGRDHIASTIYTIVFAYAGAALSVLLLIFLYERPVLDLLGTEDITTELVRSLASATGLVLTVPVTTAIAALTVAGAARRDLPVTGGDALQPASPR